LIIRYDITGRKLAENALRQHALLIEQSYEPIFIWDFERGIIEWNTGSERLYGYTREEVLGQMGYELLQTVFPIPLAEFLSELKRNGSWTGEVYQRTKMGREVVVESRQQLLELDGRKIVLVTNRDITERKRAENELRESEERYRLVAETASDAIINIDENSKILFANQAAERIFGYTSEELVGQSLTMLMPEELRDRHRAGIARYIKTGKKKLSWEGMKIPARHADGHIFLMEISFGEFKSNERHIFTGIARDVTESSRVETALRESEERYRLLFENNPFPMWVYDLKTLEFLAVNDAAVHHYGYSHEEFLSMGIKDIRPPQSVPALLENVSKTVSRLDKSGTWKHRKKDGTIIDVEITSHELIFDGRHSRLVLANDVTERKRAEEALLESENRFRTMTDNAPMLVWMSDTNKLNTYFNQAWLDFTGNTMEQELSYGWAKGIHPDDFERCLETYTTAFNARKEFEMEYRLRRFDGEYRWILDKGSPLFTPEGEFRGYIDSCIDVTERKGVEDEIRRLNETLEQRVAERTAELQAVNKELESFSYSVSHDLRAPLRAIDGFSRALLEDYAHCLDEEGLDYLRRVRAASQNMARLIDDLLKLSRVTRSEIHREKVNLSDLVREIADRLHESQPERDVTFNIQENIIAEGDERLLRVALENLLRNAWKFTSKRERAEISFGQNPAPSGGEYFVRDNGAGFDMTYADKLFGAFQRLHSAKEFEGTGVGLATVQRIVHRHGGSIRAESKPGEGAGFYFTL
jgi:PAS domain S-box-containing protein